MYSVSLNRNGLKHRVADAKPAGRCLVQETKNSPDDFNKTCGCVADSANALCKQRFIGVDLFFFTLPNFRCVVGKKIGIDRLVTINR